METNRPPARFCICSRPEARNVTCLHAACSRITNCGIHFCFSLKSEPRKHYLSSLPVREHTLQLVFKLQLIFTLLAKTHNVQLIYSNLSPACSPRNVQCKLSAPFSTRRQQCNISFMNTMQLAFYLRSKR